MAYKTTFSTTFIKNLKKLNETEKKQVKRKNRLLEENPFHPSLREKRLQGTDDLFEFRVNMDIQVICYHEGDVIIMLLDIGHHDILLKY